MALIIHYSQKYFISPCFNAIYFKYFCHIKNRFSLGRDKIAKHNMLSVLYAHVGYDTYVREAYYEENNTLKQQQELNDCNVCLRSLVDIKKTSEPLKVTECGHVFCVGCLNNLCLNVWFNNFTTIKCPTCMRNLRRDNVIQIRNLYI